MATVTGTKRHLGITSNTFDSNGDVVVGGNLTINGTTTTLDTANLLVEDKNIIIGNVSAPSDTTADGGGITLKGASDYTINWVNANDRWEFNQGIYSSGPITSAGQITGTELEGTSLDINGTGDFTGKVNFQGDAAIEGGSGYGVFKGYTANDNHFISVRGAVANTSTLTITGGHQTTFVEHADASNEGWYFKSFTTGTYREIARIDGLNEMYLGGNQVYHEGHTPTYTELGSMAYSNLTGTPTIPSGNSIIDWTTDQGSTNIHKNNVVGYINSTEPNEPFNPFAGQKFHDGVLTNALAGRHDRFVVTIDGTTEAGASLKLSNQNFEEYNQNRLFGTSAGETKVFNINVQSLATGSPSSSGITYSNGFFDINFYSSPFPASWSARVKNKDGNWTTVSSLTKIGSSKLRGVIPIGNWLTDIEFTLTARTSAPFVTGNITYGISEFELFFSRMAASQGGNISSIGGYLGGVITTASGTTSTNWNTAYAHSQATHAPTDAEANVQADWNETTTTDDAYIKNKPSTFPPSTHNHDDRYYTETEIDENLASLKGWVPAYSNTEGSSVKWDFTEDALKIQLDTDTTTGASFKARRIISGERVRFTIMAKATAASSTGVYFRLYQHNGDMPDGKTHVSNDASNSSVLVQEDDASVTNWHENSSITTDWVTYEKEYTAVADGYISLVVLNWSGIGTNSLYIKSPDIQTIIAPTVASIGNLTGHITSTNRATVLGSFTTAELNAAISDGTINSQTLPSDFVSAANGGTFNGGLTIAGSIDSAGTNMGYYESVGTNLILKGDSNGRSGIFFESEKDGTNINDPSDYGFIQFHSYGYGNTTGEANNLIIGVSNDSTDKLILQAPYNGGVMIGYKDATSGTGLTLSEVIHSNASSYNNSNWDDAYTHSTDTHAPTDAEANVQSDWTATSGDALILNKPTIPTDFVSKANGGQFDGVITIKEATNTVMTSGKSILTLHNDNSDIAQQRSFIDFKFTDTNANYTPQVRIGAQVGPDANADSIDKEGAGSFVVYTSPIGNNNAGGSTGLSEAFRVSYNKNATFGGNIIMGSGKTVDGVDISALPTTFAPTNAEQNVQSDWNATSGDALILNKPSIPAASSKGQNNNYIASNLPSSNSTYRDNFGAGVWAYSGYSTGANRPFTYDATLQVMATANIGFELSTAWHSTGEGSLKIRALRDCCEGWGDYHSIWTSDNFANNSANWDAAYSYGDHAAAGYLDTDSNLLKSDADDTFTGRLSVGSTSSRRAGIYGIYDSNKTGHIWSMGTSYMIPSNGSDFGNLYGFAYKHTNNTTGGTMGGGHQAVWCTDGTPRASIGESGIWTTGNVTHTGLTMTDGTDIDQIKSYTKSLTLTNSWLDTGVNGSELATGTYIVQVSVDNDSSNGQQYNEMYSGTMSWYSNNTNSTNHDEIVLHAAGHARNNNSIFLRVQRTVGADTDDLKLQITSNRNATQTASDYIFKFRRMI